MEIEYLLMGYSLSVMSLFGVVALSGVVVNDSLILINFANRKRQGRAGMVVVAPANRYALYLRVLFSRIK